MRTLLALVAALTMLAPVAARAQGTVVRVSGERLAKLAQREIDTLPHETNQAYVIASLVPDQVITGEHITMQAQSPVGTRSFVNVPIAIDVNGQLDRTVYVGYRVQKYIETAVAADDLDPGTVLTQDDLVLARVPFTGWPANGIDALIGRKTIGTVLKGQPVQIAQTTVNQIVTAGSTVVLIVRDSGVEVTADVLARTSGGLGDEVSVYNASTHKVLSGVVTAPGTVLLDISGGDE